MSILAAPPTVATSTQRRLVYGSSRAPGFKSRGLEISEALSESHERLQEAGVQRRLFVADRELDDAKASP